MSDPIITYLGDGLYVHAVPGMLEIYSSNGLEKTDSVFLEDETLAALLAFIERNKKENT